MGHEHRMKILFVSPYFDGAFGAEPERSIDRYPILSELPRALRERGHQVQFLGLAETNSQSIRDGVHYRWVPAALPVRLLGRALHHWKPHYGPAYYQPSLRLAYTARRLNPDIVHVFGLTMDLQLALIQRLASDRSHIVVHYHGGEPPTGALRKRLQRFALSGVEAACFTSLSQADGWIDAGLMAAGQLHQVLETSSPFGGINRDDAQEQTGMRGDPVYLSAGRLHPIKDPLTMLRGFAHIARQQPEARLYLYYLTDELLHDARALVHSFPHLRDRVEFRGRAQPSDMEAIYSSADFLLQASLREWSGLAILEAMSCGCIPIVTNIPSFAAMTHDGRYGKLFMPGDPRDLASAALSIDDRDGWSAKVKHYFDDELSFAAMARRLEAIYASLLSPA